MKTTEIKALVAELKQYRSGRANDCLDAIETLLARQAEVVKYAEEYTLHAAPIRAILNQENET